MTSTDRHAGNIAFLEKAAAQAASYGAELLALPEVAGLMTLKPRAPEAGITTAEKDPYLKAAAQAAKQHGLWIAAGTTPVKGPADDPDDRFHNHACLFDAEGALHASYDKIHLFDVQLDGQAATGESKRYAPGTKAVITRTPWGKWGLSVCYDLRFPHLYRAYAQAGARVLFIPSAFTVPTGRAHWEVLLRARAIENCAFVIAAAQVGQHDDGRETWGHSMVVDPWGKVLLDMGGERPGLATLTLDLSEADRARAQIPSLTHDRPFTLSES